MEGRSLDGRSNGSKPLGTGTVCESTTRICLAFDSEFVMISMRSEHPKDEEDFVIREGRVLGGLEPSRAFGDARYKWPRIVQET